MKERPVIFNGEMVRAIIDGRKTQTRRVMKVQPSEHFHPMNMSLELDYSARWYTPGVIDKDGYLQPATGQVFGVAGEDEGYACPFGAVGDLLWVRETWSSDFANYYPNDRVWYAADNNRCSDIEVVNGVRGIYSPESDVHVPFRWRPSIHMPRWASRITLEITGVRVERLNDISDGDAISEGCSTADMKSGECVADVFARLWSSIYGGDSWNANPWVWVIEFKPVEAQHG
ncbi:hypothetical protein ACTVKS_15350 [Serratia bockelmannii]|uniref:hypothetical protein n=1 Tax=Serratia bockelmannii TaxID=2703793 RepID=UPI003FA78948